MSNDTIDITEHSITEHSILDDLKGTRDALSVRRVFGDPTTIDGVTIIPVARVSGGGGGGGGEGTGPGNEGGHGFGTGFGLGAQAVGVYRIRDGELSWEPAIDMNRLLRGGQVFASIVTVCVSLVLMRRSR